MAERRDPPTVVLPDWVGRLTDRGVQGSLVLLGGALAGFVALGLGWAGMAARVQPPLQIPFLVSGAFGGIALIGGCAGLLAVHLERRTSATERWLLEQAVRTAGELAESAPAAVARRVSARKAGGSPAVLVRSRNTVHLASCRWASGRDLPPAGAADPSLQPCRTCRPPMRGAPR